jgi:hypothetical protein
MKKGDHQPGEVAAKPRSNPICPTRKILNMEPGYRYSTTPVHLMWVTAKRLKREDRSLGYHPCDYFSLTSGTYLTVPYKQLQQPKPSISTKSNQTGARIKH